MNHDAAACGVSLPTSLSMRLAMHGPRAAPEATGMRTRFCAAREPHAAGMPRFVRAMRTMTTPGCSGRDAMRIEFPGEPEVQR